MEIFNTLKSNNNLSLALGFFDGVHSAHKKILKTAVLLAKENGLKSAVITFQTSPGGHFDPKKNINIQTLNDRLKLIEETGMDYAYVLNFQDFMNFSASEYLNNVLIKYFSPKFITTGFNHTFGLNKEGDSKFLAKYSGSYKYIEIEKLRINNTLVSSTNIKRLLEKAYIKEANEILGYNFNLNGTVEHGLKVARKLGYKTANIKWPENIVKLPYGVYFGEVEYKNVKYSSLINWGVKPTIAGRKDILFPILEAHILNFDKEIYGENIRVYFKAPLREEKKFNTLEELKAAIADDIKTGLSLKL